MRLRSETAQAKCNCYCACGRMAYVTYGGQCRWCREGSHGTLIGKLQAILDKYEGRKVRRYIKKHEAK